MVTGRVSVLIPARNEDFLVPTVVDVLRQATGDVEVIVVLEGYWPQPMPAEDPRLHLLHWGVAQGLRPSLNAAVQMSTGQFLFKLDAHCALGKGYDMILKHVCGESDVVVPEKYSLMPETWTRFRDPWHYFYVTWPWAEGLPCVGLQDRNYGPEYNQPRLHQRVDDILSYQGSAWMLRRTWWDRILPRGMDADHYYFAQEPQEVGFATWLNGGRCRIVKDAWYAHLHKGHSHKRQFLRHKRRWNEAMAWSARYWMQQPGFEQLIHRFAPLPGWPTNWPEEAAQRWAT